MRARDFLIPPHAVVVAAMATVVLAVSGPRCAMALFVALVGASLALLRVSARRDPQAAVPGAFPRMGVFALLLRFGALRPRPLDLLSGDTLVRVLDAVIAAGTRPRDIGFRYVQTAAGLALQRIGVGR